MSYSKLFEQIYENNLEDDTKHDFLDFPLDAENKPPVWMKESLFERILREEHLREMARVKFADALKRLINLMKSSLTAIKSYISNWILLGGDEGVYFLNKENKPVNAEDWIQLLVNEVKKAKAMGGDYNDTNTTYGQIATYNQRLDIILDQAKRIIQFARKNGWTEDKGYTTDQRKSFEALILNELELSSIRI